MGLFKRLRRQSAEPEAEPGAEAEAPSPNPQGLVVPLLVGQAWLDANESMFARIPNFPKDAYPWTRPLADGLFVSYATDPDGSWQQVQTGQVDTFGGPDALHAAAITNLKRRAAGRITATGAGGRHRVEIADEPDLSASLALVPELWLPAVAITGVPVLCVPTRVELLVCGDQDTASLASLREFAPKLFEEARGKPVAPSLFTLSGAGIVALA